MTTYLHSSTWKMCNDVVVARSISSPNIQNIHVPRIQIVTKENLTISPTMSSKTPLDIVFGCMTFGREGEEQVRTSDINDCAAILDTFQSYGHDEVDTSRFYGVRTPIPSRPPLPTELTNSGRHIGRIPRPTLLAEARPSNGHQVLPQRAWAFQSYTYSF